MSDTSGATCYYPREIGPEDPIHLPDPSPQSSPQPPPSPPIPVFIGYETHKAPNPVFEEDMTNSQMEKEAWRAVMDNTQQTFEDSVIDFPKLKKQPKNKEKESSPEEQREEEDESFHGKFDSPPEMPTKLVEYDTTSGSSKTCQQQNFSEEKTLTASTVDAFHSNEGLNVSEALYSDDEPIVTPSPASSYVPDTQHVSPGTPTIIPETQAPIPETQLPRNIFIRPTSRLPDIVESKVLEDRWEDLHLHLLQHNRVLLPAVGDGNCFLNSIEQALTCDHHWSLNVDAMSHMIIGELQDNLHIYSEAHIGEPEQLIADAITFFRSKNDRMDVVDVIIMAANHALHLDIYIYQETNGFIEVRKLQSRHQATKSVYVKFTRGQLQPDGTYTGAHYDSLVKRGSISNLVLIISDEEDEPQKAVEVQCQMVQASAQEEASAERSPATLSPQDVFEISDSEIGTLITEQLKAKRIKLPDALFRNMQPEWVDEVPKDVDGNQLYHIRTTIKGLLFKQDDRRHFEMKVSKRKGFSGRRRVGWCAGSQICKNERCPFFKSSCERNVSHLKGGLESRNCFSCGQPATQVACPARKMTEYDYKTSILRVCHLNKHTCTLKLDKEKYDAQLQKISESYPHLPAMTAIREDVLQHVRAGDITGAIAAAKESANTRRFLKIHKKTRRRQIQGRSSFEAVAIVKESTDPSDKYKVYKMNPEGMNNQPGFVFKTAEHALQLCVDMDCSKGGSLSEQECFFDGSHSRCMDWITLCAWVYHPALRALQRIATMEVRSESTEHIALFWKLLNEALQDFTGKKSYKFNPCAFLVDEGGGNHCGIQEAFGIEVATKIYTCQMHSTKTCTEELCKFLMLK